MLRRPAILTASLLLVQAAHAVVVRGRVTTPLGVPLPGARVQLIVQTRKRGPQTAADAVSGLDGSYELRSAARGRFVLLVTSSLVASRPALLIDGMFYAGRTDLVTRDVAVDPDWLTPRVSAVSTRMPIPLAALAEPPSRVQADALQGAQGVVEAAGRLASSFVLREGTWGTPVFLYVRGAAPAFVRSDVEGEEAGELGGALDLRRLSSVGLAAFSPEPAVELVPGAQPLAGVDAAAGVLSFHAARAMVPRASLAYAGDAGNLATLRQQGTGALVLGRLEALADYARFDTDSGDPALGAHQGSAAADLRYSISAGTSLRATLRQDGLAAPLAVPMLLFAAPPQGRGAAQDLLGTGVFDTRSARGWHTAVRYGLARRRAQTLVFLLPAQLASVTVRGANGSSATAVPTLPAAPAREDAITVRDTFAAETDLPWRPWLRGVLSAGYRRERAADRIAGGQALSLGREHLHFALGLQGSLAHHRVSYEAAGLADHSEPFGWMGAPRLGLSYTPVLEGTRRMRGTTLRAAAATGFREPALLEQASVAAPEMPRTRTVSVGVDQTVLPGKLTFAATYFHTQAAHDFEPAGPRTFTQGLSWRAQGLETTLHWQPARRLGLFAGYTYLTSLVEHSDAAPATNPALPGVAIGARSALAGARPFHRPPHTGWFALSYTGTRLAGTFAGNASSRSDASTGEAVFAPGGSALLLPNRDLAPGFVALDADVSYALSGHITVYTRLTNLLDDRDLAPIGFQATPFGIRTGLRLRVGRE